MCFRAFFETLLASLGPTDTPESPSRSPTPTRGRRTRIVHWFNRQRSGTPVQTLPPEILCLIFDFLRRDPPTLLSSALVCRRWRDPAQRTLFVHLSMRFPRVNLKAWLSSPGRARFVTRSLFADPAARSARGVSVVFAACPGLLEVETSASELFWEELCAPTLSGLRHLSLYGAHKIVSHPSQPHSTLPFHLHSLELYFSRGMPASPWLHTLFSTSSATLTSLVLSAGVDTKPPCRFENIAPVFPLVAPNLIRLTLSLTPFPTSLLPALGGCTHLRHLSLVAITVKETVDALQQNLLLLATSLPGNPTITRLHLAIGDRRVVPDHIVVALRQPAFAKLAHLDLPLHFRAFGPYLAAPELNAECDGRGIGVRWTNDMDYWRM